MSQIYELSFLTESKVRELVQSFGTPFYVYDEKTIKHQIHKVLGFPNAFGLAVRYAMKANSNKNLLRLVVRSGLEIDASSGYEVERALAAGITPRKIMLTAQELPEHFESFIEQGILFNASSLQQLEIYGMLFPKTKTGIRVNPGLGSGSTNRTNVGGPASSFGIWHEDTEEVDRLCRKYKLKVSRIHTHIGSGSDPEVWKKTAGMSFKFVEMFPDAVCLNLGGGYKIARYGDEKTTDLQKIGEPVKKIFEEFCKISGRKIKLEIEPGTFIMGNSGALVTMIQDTTSTGHNGYKFLKTDAGMNDLIRPSLYGAQHPIISVGKYETSAAQESYIVSGHCCESGDIFTPAAADPEGLEPRLLRESHVDDYLVIEGAGAYSASMSAKNYNSFPEIPEILIRETGEPVLIREKQTLSQMIQNETDAVSIY